ncbi:Hypothetical protein SMA_0786 [Streptococcus macedonicus ACA-DC 198]|nr:Hypothetical protein SMA_0786 [Streptococcus macedonicus ACA-DC 198]SCA89324.1 hypothetical protein SMA679_0763 [Streptococcus macedonicus]
MKDVSYLYRGRNEMGLNMTLEQSEEQARSTQSVCQAE